jgi:chromosome segregation ATPase
LVVALYLRHADANKKLTAATAQSLHFSNECEEVGAKLTDQKRVNIMLLTNLASRSEALVASSNDAVKLKATLAKAEEETRAARLEIEERDKRISEWETSHTELADKANEFKTSLSALDREITEVKKKLDASEGDRAFLLKELKRLQTEKDQLAGQFYDLPAVRAQLEKLKNEEVISRRFKWARGGEVTRPAYRGGEVLVSKDPDAAGGRNYNLKVELQQDGSVKLVPAATSPSEKRVEAKAGALRGD